MIRSVAVLVAACLVAAPLVARAQAPTLEQALFDGGRYFPRAEARVYWIDKETYVVEKDSGKFAFDARTGEQRPIKPLSASPAAEPAPGRGRRRGNGGSSTHPSGAFTVAVRKNDVYVTETATKKERRVTRDGSATIHNGALDWVYDEEVYGRGSKQVFRWSSDGRFLAFLRIDEGPVKPFVLVDHLPKLQGTELELYPKAGEPNPTAKLLIADMSRPEGEPVAVDLGLYPDDDLLIVRFGFTPDGKRVLVQVQNREQNKLDLLSADPITGRDVRIWIQEKNDKGWVDVADTPQWLADGSFLWWSTRDGHRHLYRYRGDGAPMGQVTRGPWDVRSVVKLDEAAGTVLVETNGADVSGTCHARARLDGTGEPVVLTQGGGTHSLVFAPGDAYFLDTVSDAENPGEVRVCDAAGKVLRTVARMLPPDAPADALGIARFVRFPARDGYPLEGTLLLPPKWDGRTPLPVFQPVYSGPDAPTARNSWSAVNGNAYHQFLARNGIAVWTSDNRTANPRGNAARFAQYRDFGASELRDLEDGLAFLAAKGIHQPGRAAISGWSFGGFMTAYALTRSKAWSVGVAGAGVMDWHLYDTIYTERYMSTPQRNPAGYRSSSVVENANGLSGKLLIVHGMMDDNVHMQNSVKLAYALQKSGKQFDMMFYPAPTSRHGIGDPDQSRHERLLAARYVLSHLLPGKEIQ